MHILLFVLALFLSGTCHTAQSQQLRSISFCLEGEGAAQCRACRLSLPRYLLLNNQVFYTCPVQHDVSICLFCAQDTGVDCLLPLCPVCHSSPPSTQALRMFKLPYGATQRERFNNALQALRSINNTKNESSTPQRTTPYSPEPSSLAQRRYSCIAGSAHSRKASLVSPQPLPLHVNFAQELEKIKTITPRNQAPQLECTSCISTTKLLLTCTGAALCLAWISIRHYWRSSHIVQKKRRQDQQDNSARAGE